MCQFCHQYGEGKKWYLRAEHYSMDLLADMERRRYISSFVRNVGSARITSIESSFERALRLPQWLRQIAYFFYEQRYRRDHFGQVVPLEDLFRVLALANSLVRLPCLCRKATTGRSDARYCIGLGLDPEKLFDVRDAFFDTFRPGPDTNLFEKLTLAEAIELHQAFEKEGLIHSVWTFKTPFIGAICNCDRADCLAMVAHLYDFRIFFRAEYVAEVGTDRCIGCRACLSMCQFGALWFSVAHRKAFVDPLRCYGCGICRSACEYEAIHLIPRTARPLARNQR